MIRYLPLMLLALAACDAPLEEVYPRQVTYVEHAERTYRVRYQYDPFEFAWSTSVWTPDGKLEAADRDVALEVVRQVVAPQACGGGTFIVGEGEQLNPLAGSHEDFNDGTGIWQFVGTCS